MPKILIVDDQERVARAISILLDLHGFASEWAEGTEDALRKLAERPFDLVIQDMNFTPGRTDGDEGLELFRRIRKSAPEIPVLLITAWGSVEGAVRLMREGAADYLEKPWDDERLVTRVRDLLGAARGSGDPERLRDELAEHHDLGGLVYASPAMHEVVTLALRVAKADVPVLITGPNGTGKEKIAELVQAGSPRRDRPFVRVNAGALPENLLEAELFGAEAGAFTGAGERRQGRFEAADRGTLLLDEIGNLPLAGQAKLLRILESGAFERLGSSRTRHVDVRILAATNTDLELAMARGTFREDLFFRLNVIQLEVPPLADRPEDILLLTEHFLRQLAPDRPHLHPSSAARQDTSADCEKVAEPRPAISLLGRVPSSERERAATGVAAPRPRLNPSRRVAIA